MLDIKFIRNQKELILKGAKAKNIEFNLDRLLELDSQIQPLQRKLEELRGQRNNLSKEIGTKNLNSEQKTNLIKSVQAIKAKIEQLESNLQTLTSEFDELMLLVPQPPRDDVPIGKDESANKVIKIHGEIPKFQFKIKDHVELGKLHDMIDIQRGVKLAGSRSYVLKNMGALLERAVLQFTIDYLLSKNYTPLSVPVLVNPQAMYGTGYFPQGKEQAYYIEKDNMVLIGTAEVSLTSFHANEILKEEELPLKYFALSYCFRREAGSYGKDTYGLYRVHQFQKVEQVIIGKADPSMSEKYHQELLNNAEEIMQALNIPYRVVYVCTGDLGQGQVRKHDIEAWMPSRNAYSETHSCSTFHDFQARRLKLRYKDSKGNIHYCYTLNNTAIATPRILIPLIENYQQEDGSILIPPCLQKYLPITKISK